MVSSHTDIQNLALDKLGQEMINSENDDNPRARLVKRLYPIGRDYLLRSHPWRFNKGYSTLAALATKPPGVYDYDYVFQLPSDCLRVVEVSCHGAWEEIEGNRIAANTDALTVKFCRRIEDATKFDANFIDVLACWIAKEAAFSLTQNASLVETMEGKYNQALRESRTYSAQTGSTKQVGANDWLVSRHR